MSSVRCEHQPKNLFIRNAVVANPIQSIPSHRIQRYRVVYPFIIPANPAESHIHNQFDPIAAMKTNRQKKRSIARNARMQANAMPRQPNGLYADAKQLKQSKASRRRRRCARSCGSTPCRSARRRRPTQRGRRPQRRLQDSLATVVVLG